MTEQVQTTPPPVTPQEAKARAKADKAYAKASRPWFKKKRFIIPLLIVIIAVIMQLANGDSPAPGGAQGGSAAVDGSQAVNDTAAAAKVGDKVRDGKFEFVVKAVENRGKSIGSGVLRENAQGEFILVTIDVANTGDEAQTLDSTGQVVFNDKGQKFEPSSALLSLEGADKFFLEKINPGNKVTGAPLLFDVPVGTTITSIELHDSMFSDGVKVALS